MKKLLTACLLFFAFSCGGNRDASTETTVDQSNTEENVEIGSGEEISPQLESDNDSARLKVDTVSSSQEINQQQEE